MSFANQTFVDNIDIGTLLKIVSTKGVYSNLSTQSDIWKYLLRLRADPKGGREIRYSIMTERPLRSIQSLPAGSSGAYPTATRGTYPEGRAHLKDFGLTVNVPRNVINKTGEELLQYADPLKLLLDETVIAAARIMCAQSMGDGSGAIGRISGVPVVVDNGSFDRLTITLSTASLDAGRSHVGWFELGDHIKAADETGTAQVVTTSAGTPDYLKIVDRSIDNNTVTVEAYDANNVLLNITSANQLEDGDYLYRYGTTPNDLTAIGTNDWEGLSECMVGFEALAAAGAQYKVHNIARTGAAAGTTVDCNAEALDSKHFQRLISMLRITVGKNRYPYRECFMFQKTYDQLIESRETDRRFTTMQDAKRGTQVMGYQYGKMFVEFTDDEFVPGQRVWMPPESRDVLKFHGMDFEMVEVNPGQKFYLANGAANGSHLRQQNAYMEGAATVICYHPAAIGSLRNFTVA